jgi:hypothetical protein
MLMAKLIRKTGLKYFYESSKIRRNCAIYRCDCGNEYEAVISVVNSGKDYQFCKECYKTKKSKALKKARTKHGQSGTKLGSVFRSMKARCNSPKCNAYKNYGARGIKVCDEWMNDSSSFFKWALANGYKEKLQIDRIDNNKGYSPENCRWVERHVNAQNKRPRKKKSNLPIGTFSHHNRSKIYKCKISDKKKIIYLGAYKTKYESAKAYNDYIEKNNTYHTKNNLEEWKENAK